ncbi:MAG TPA: hypothetical protein VF377_15695 [Acidimicrobiia bacterium]|jgi:hypothetical protein
MTPADDLARDVQMYGALSAASVVARYAAKVDTAMASVTDDAWDPTVIASMAVFARETIGPLFEPRSRPERVVLPAVIAGETSAGSLWLHDPGPLPGGRLELSVSPLVSGRGDVIPSSALSVSPRVVESMAAGGRQEVRLAAAVPFGQAAGWYHGWVFLITAPDEPVAVALRVEEAGR